MTTLIATSDWDGVETCNTCRQPVGFDAPVCECCSEPVCLSCRDEIGGMTHCPECAQLAREFINGGGCDPTEVPGNGQKQLSR